MTNIPSSEGSEPSKCTTFHKDFKTLTNSRDVEDAPIGGRLLRITSIVRIVCFLTSAQAKVLGSNKLLVRFQH